MAKPHSSDLPTRVPTERDATPHDLLEQYKLAVGSWNQEMQRFWFRFNVLVGLELAVLIGLVAKYEEIKQHPFMFRLVLSVMVFYSVSTLAIVHHGIDVYGSIVSILIAIEKRSNERLFLIHLFMAQPISMRDPRGMWYGVGIQAALTTVWLAVGVHEIYMLI